MQVAIDALGLPSFGGAKISALNWLVALGRHDLENRYLVFLSRPEEILSSFSNMEQRIVPVHNRFAVRIWAQLYLPRMLAREKVALLHGAKNLGIFGAPCPTIITINDLSHVILRGLYPWVDGFYWQVIQPFILRHAARIIAISESTKHDLMRWYGLDADRIVVIYPSCAAHFRQPCEPKEMKRVQARYNLPKSFLLYVGGLAIHKNVITLVQAFAQIASEIPHGLVLVGGAHHTTSECDLPEVVFTLGLEDRVWILGSVPAEDLPPLYHLADLFLFASLNEGFGLVLLEAMACGTPVLAASSGSVSEVMGDAGWLLSDPLDVEEFAAAIVTLLADHNTLARMSACGLERSRLFTWERTVERTLTLYQEVTNEQARR